MIELLKKKKSKQSYVCDVCSLDLQEGDLKAMSLGLAHSLSRYKLKFSPDKVDTMIVQAIGMSYAK